jgi:hypothetical protein
MQSVPPTPGLPMRHEEEAHGLVAAVFADVRSRMPFVPALFKALAVDPSALELAWLQGRALYDDPRSHAAAAELREAAGEAGPAYRASEPVRQAVAPFAQELPAMLLIATSLLLALDGVLAVRPKPELRLSPGRSDPGPGLPESREEHPLFAEIREVYGTAYVPSMFRSLAALGLLEQPWRAIGPFLTSPRGLELIGTLTEAAEDTAARFPEVAFFDAESARPVLDQFRAALPRNLVFAVAASATGRKAPGTGPSRLAPRSRRARQS